MRLLFLFMSMSSASPGQSARYSDIDCHPMYDKHNGEGYFRLVEDLLDQEVFDDAYVFYESNRGPGRAHWVNHPKAYCEVIPEIRYVEEYITEDTVIWARGGFKHWFELLMKYKGRNWLVLYAANTGREKWPFWDVVLNDLNLKVVLDTRGRLNYPFIKPVDESIFYYEGTKQIYDLCIGASFIHDKKGQWMAVEAIEILNKKYGKQIKAVMPGAVRRSLKTVEMFDKVRSSKELSEQIYFPSFVTKEELMKIFNQSKFFCHMGNHGQNDRGPLEAAACGTQVILRSPKYHSPILTEGNAIIVKDAEGLATFLSLGLSYDKKMKAESFQRRNGYKQVSFPLFKKLFFSLTIYKPTLASKKAISLMDHFWKE